jgi:hypothetical protein
MAECIPHTVAYRSKPEEHEHNCKGMHEHDYLQVSAARTPSCKDSRRNAMLRHDQALKESLDEVAKAGFRAVT